MVSELTRSEPDVPAPAEAPGDDRPGSASPTSDAWKASAALALAGRVLLFGVPLMTAWLLSASTSGVLSDGFDDLWRRWDAEHFLDIARHGYNSSHSDPHSAAFFPLFPLIVRAMMWLGANGVIAGALVSAVASVVAGAFLYRLAEEEIGEGAGWRALAYLTFFPTAVFLIAPYSEALFLAGAIPAFYFARRRRWALVGIPAAVAMGARAAGLFLLVGLFVQFLSQRDFRAGTIARAALSLAVGLVPLLAYGAFLSQAMGDPFAFLEAQREGWGRDFVGPVSAFLTTWRTWDDTYATNWLLAWRLEIVAAAIGVWVTIALVARREWGYVAFVGTMLASLLTSSWYFSVPRMLLSMFPIPLLLAQTTLRRPRWHDALLVSFACLASAGAVVFTQGKWFF